jgi:uncharacterized membrane protein
MTLPDRFFSKATLLAIVVGAVLVVATLTIAQSVFHYFLPESMRFDNWPFWLQAPFVVVVALFLILEMSFLLRHSNEAEDNKPRKRVGTTDGRG